MQIIPLVDHPLNTDRTAWLCTVDRQWTGREIFRHSPKATGPVFLACLPDGQCFVGTFPTESAARAAQDAYFASKEA